jgi:hypothetical protein
MMFRYYIPLIYTYVTRCNNIFRFISFLVYECLLSFFIATVNHTIDFWLIVNYAVTFIVMYSAYEIGYLFNDIVTIKFEQNPTIRIVKKYINIIPKHLENLLTIRLLIIVAGCYWLCQFTFNINVLVITLLLLMLVYSAHNYYRNRVNIATMFLLVLLKNFFLAIPFIAVEKFIEIVFVITITIAAVRTYEFAAKSRFNLNIKIKNIDSFRIQYYTVLSIVFATLAAYAVLDWSYFVLAFLFLVYRLGTYVVLKYINLRELM